jgi:DNA-binding response OmpR family regulator
MTDATSLCVLVVDDDAPLAHEVAATLGRYGFRPVIATNWDSAVEQIRTSSPDVILLDQHLGPVDALTRLGELRAETSVPILIVTGNGEAMDRVLGLETGADDFVVKPVSGRELVARIRAIMRRTAAPAPAPKQGGWKFSEQSMSLTRPDGRRVPLTSAEFMLFAALAASPAQPVSRDALSRAAFGRDWRFGDRSVDNAVLAIRRKLGHPDPEAILRTVRNVGYVFVGFPQDTKPAEDDAS